MPVPARLRASCEDCGSAVSMAAQRDRAVCGTCRRLRDMSVTVPVMNVWRDPVFDAVVRR